MLPSEWKHELATSPLVALLRLMPDSPAGAIVDLRKALGGLVRELSAKTLVVDIREHDHRCPGTREAMADLSDEAANYGRRVLFVAEAIRGKHHLVVLPSVDLALAMASKS